MSTTKPVTLMSRVTHDGTAMSEATLCGNHYSNPYIDWANSRADCADDSDISQSWRDSSANDWIKCNECGTGIDRRV